MTTYRLPDWLGGHEVKPLGREDNGLMRVKTPHSQIAVPADILVEVKPPSIDDPVTLPLRIAGRGNGWLTVEPSPYPDAAARICIGALNRDVEAADSLDLARALWKLGTGGES